MAKSRATELQCHMQAQYTMHNAQSIHIAHCRVHNTHCTIAHVWESTVIWAAVARNHLVMASLWTASASSSPFCLIGWSDKSENVPRFFCHGSSMKYPRLRLHTLLKNGGDEKSCHCILYPLVHICVPIYFKKSEQEKMSKYKKWPLAKTCFKLKIVGTVIRFVCFSCHWVEINMWDVASISE